LSPHIVSGKQADSGRDRPCGTRVARLRDLGGFASDVWWSNRDHLPEGGRHSVSSRLGVHLLPNVVASRDSTAGVISVKNSVIGQGLVHGKGFLMDGRRRTSYSTANGVSGP
jgi:hypothetical protein